MGANDLAKKVKLLRLNLNGQKTPMMPGAAQFNPSQGTSVENVSLVQSSFLCVSKNLKTGTGHCLRTQAVFGYERFCTPW